MKHILLFPTWLIMVIVLTVLILLLRFTARKRLLKEAWNYKDFVRVSINKSKV